MAKKVKQENGQDGHGVSAIRGNGYDPDAVKKFVGRVENLAADKATIHSAYMSDCKRVGDDINIVYDEAKNAGIPKKELKSAIKKRDLQNKIENLRNKLEGEQQDNYDAILLALGDLGELGAAASLKMKAAA